MKPQKLPPYVVLDPSKEVIFFVRKKYNSTNDIDEWMKEINLPHYNGMVINSKCVFNKLKDQDCK